MKKPCSPRAPLPPPSLLPGVCRGSAPLLALTASLSPVLGLCLCVSPSAKVPMASFFLPSRSSKGLSFTSTHTHTPLSPAALVRSPIKSSAPPPQCPRSLCHWPGRPPSFLCKPEATGVHRGYSPAAPPPLLAFPLCPLCAQPCLPGASGPLGKAWPCSKRKPDLQGWGCQRSGQVGRGHLLLRVESISAPAVRWLLLQPASQPREPGQLGGRAGEVWGLAVRAHGSGAGQASIPVPISL